MDVLAKAVAAIEQADMLSPGGRVAVALSGGADSVALLHVLLALRDRLPLREVVAVHVNHQLRVWAVATGQCPYRADTSSNRA